MKEKIIRFFKMWTLPLGMFAGVGVYLMFHYISWLSPLKVLAGGAEDYILPAMVFIQLFATFCKVNPREMRLKRWHVVMLAVQLTCCLAVALPIHFFPHFEYNVVAQGALVCLIVPTGTAAAVIAGRLGGNETTLTTYTILNNLVAAVMIPAVFPLVEMQSAGSFGQQFLLILRRVFPLLLTPFFAAWALREFLPKLHVLVVKWCGSLAFYLWGVSLVIAIGLTLRSVVNSHFDPHVMCLAIRYRKAGGQTLPRLYQLRARLQTKEHDTCHLGILYLPYSGYLRGAQLLYCLAEYRELLAAVAERETGCTLSYKYGIWQLIPAVYTTLILRSALIFAALLKK